MTHALVEGAPVAPIEPSDELKRLLSDAGTDEATRLLQRYFTPMPQGAFSGAHFERFAGSGDRFQVAADDQRPVAHVFTSDDLVAVSMLSVNIRGAAALAILEQRADRLSHLLMQIPPHVPLAQVPAAALGEQWPVRTLYTELRSIESIGPTAATKLMARKRPHLVPILDSVITRELKIVRGQYWARLHAWLTADGCANDARLQALREAAGLEPGISNLRVFDVLAWMVGARHTRPGDAAT